MGKKNINYKIILLTPFFVFVICYLKAQTYSEFKKIERSFKVIPSSTVDITNKYGKIHIVKWDKDSVKFIINLSVKTDELEEAEEILKNIDINFSGTHYYVTAKTHFQSDENSFLDDIKKLTEGIVESESEVRIDYTIHVPGYLNLKINNKYGNVYSDDIQGNFDLILSNGDFEANSINGNCVLDLKFGKAVINSLNTGDITIAYSDLYVKHAKQLSINSKSSEVNIDYINVLKTQSKRDKYYVTETNYLYGQTYFCDYWVYLLNKEVSMEMKYGSLHLEEISSTFSFLNIDSKYTELNFNFKKGTSYQLDITHENVNLVYPKELAKIEKKTIEDDKFITYGKIGNAGTSAKLRIKAQGRAIKIYHKQ